MSELAEVKQKNKDYKELIRTLQKEADKCQGELKNMEKEKDDAMDVARAFEKDFKSERDRSSLLITNMAELTKKYNAAEQKAVLWANQYFEFMQKAIDQSATQMTTPPKQHPMSGAKG